MATDKVSTKTTKDNKKSKNDKKIDTKKGDKKKTDVKKTVKKAIKKTDKKKSNTCKRCGKDNEKCVCRFFRLVSINGKPVKDENDERQGRYRGIKPKQAGNKAFSSIVKKRSKNGEKINKTIYYAIRECTRGSKHKTYFYYGKRKVLDIPTKLETKDGKEIVYKHKNIVKRDKDATLAHKEELEVQRKQERAERREELKAKRQAKREKREERKQKQKEKLREKREKQKQKKAEKKKSKSAKSKKSKTSKKTTKKPVNKKAAAKKAKGK